MLTLQSHFSVDDLRAIDPLNGSLTARAWDAVRGLVQTVARTQAPRCEGVAGKRVSQSNAVDGAPRILARGLERC